MLFRNFKHSLYGEIFPFNQNDEVPIDKKNTLPFYLATGINALLN